ncbi:hypothetical protein A8B78_16250 [Jannaschia sp. EhC01]|nr:hypothetical protein A8B78_16250 [Jannaschia sp. EhC01]
MSQDMFLTIAFSAMIAMFAVMLIVGLPRGKRVQTTNDKIAEQQTRQIALQERNTDLQERTVIALERIATTLERRGG